MKNDDASTVTQSRGQHSPGFKKLRVSLALKPLATVLGPDVSAFALCAAAFFPPSLTPLLPSPEDATLWTPPLFRSCAFSAQTLPEVAGTDFAAADAPAWLGDGFDERDCELRAAAAGRERCHALSGCQSSHQWSSA